MYNLIDFFLSVELEHPQVAKQIRVELGQFTSDDFCTISLLQFVCFELLTQIEAVTLALNKVVVLLTYLYLFETLVVVTSCEGSFQ